MNGESARREIDPNEAREIEKKCIVREGMCEIAKDE